MRSNAECLAATGQRLGTMHMRVDLPKAGRLRIGKAEQGAREARIGAVRDADPRSDGVSAKPSTHLAEQQAEARCQGPWGLHPEVHALLAAVGAEQLADVQVFALAPRVLRLVQGVEGVEPDAPLVERQENLRQVV